MDGTNNISEIREQSLRDTIRSLQEELAVVKAERDAYAKAINQHNAEMAKVTSMRGVPQTAQEGMRVLADWFDRVYQDAGKNDKVQRDLRRWANDIDEILKQRDELLNEAHDFECSIASALGWDTKGETMDDMVRRIVRERNVLTEFVGSVGSNDVLKNTDRKNKCTCDGSGRECVSCAAFRVSKKAECLAQMTQTLKTQVWRNDLSDTEWSGDKLANAYPSVTHEMLQTPKAGVVKTMHGPWHRIK